MNKKIAPFIEYASESTMACVVTMAQGNIFAITMGHLLMASETGLIAGAITATSVMLSRTSRRWMISMMLGLVTAVVDFFMHTGTFGAVATEAIVTGIGAAVLSLLFGTLISRLKVSRSNRTSRSESIDSTA